MTEHRRTIWKFPLGLKDRPYVDMPEGAEILHFNMRGGVLTIWALVVPGRPLVSHQFALLGTGHPAPSDEIGQYIGTCFDGSLVWHLFKRL